MALTTLHSGRAHGPSCRSSARSWSDHLLGLIVRPGASEPRCDGPDRASVQLDLPLAPAAFSYARILTPGEPSLLLMGMLALATLPLSWLTWRFVEQPFRKRARIGGFSRRCYFLGLNGRARGDHRYWIDAGICTQRHGTGQYREADGRRAGEVSNAGGRNERPARGPTV